MTGAEPNQPSAPGPADEIRVSVVAGDRLCTQCGYNLTGQTVIREPHYSLLIVRCPECATAASLQEYPLLGRWANRWGALLAVLWFIFLLGAWLGSSAATFGWSVAIAEDASRGYSDFLQIRMQSDLAAAAAASNAPATAVPGSTSMWGQPFVTWWNGQDQDALFASAGGWSSGVRWTALFLLIPGSFASFALGLFWSIALLRFRRRWLPVWGLFVLGLAMLFAGLTIADWITGTPNWVYDAGRGQIGPPFFVAAIAYSYLPLLIGMYLGRPLTRLGVRALLPPGLRGSLAILWTAEGLEPPRTGGIRPNANRTAR